MVDDSSELGEFFNDAAVGDERAAERNHSGPDLFVFGELQRKCDAIERGGDEIGPEPREWECGDGGRREYEGEGWILRGSVECDGPVVFVGSGREKRMRSRGK